MSKLMHVMLGYTLMDMQF